MGLSCACYNTRIMKTVRLLSLFVFAAFLLINPAFAQENAKKADITILFHTPQTNYWSTSLPRVTAEQSLRIRVFVLNSSNQTLRDVTVEELVPAPLRLQDLSAKPIDMINAGAEKYVDYTIAYDRDRFAVNPGACTTVTTVVKVEAETLDTEGVNICYGSSAGVLGAITENPQTAVDGYELFGFAAILLGLGNLAFAYISTRISRP